jgi:hypothetical protein
MVQRQMALKLLSPGRRGEAKRIRKTGLQLVILVMTCGWAQATDAIPTLESIVDHMVQARDENRARLRPYQVTRDYKLFSGAETKNIKSQVTAGVSFMPPSSKQYEIQAASGQSLGESIVRQVLASEAELLKNQAATDISPENYEFRLRGQEDLNHHKCFVLDLRPRRKDKHLLRGTIWLDADTYLTRRIEGEPAKSPSMWVHNVHISLDYSDVEGMWLQTSSESTADVLLLGSHKMISRDTDYKVSSVAAAAAGSRTTRRTVSLRR